SSHALSLHRTEGCEIDVGVLTNVTQDHLDFHATFEAYVAAKARLFRLLTQEACKAGKLAVLNVDDPHWQTMRQATQAPTVLYGLSPDAEVRAEEVRLHPQGSAFWLVSPQGRAPVQLRLPARYNVANALAAAARSEEHTSELQSRENVVCRLLPEKENISVAMPAAVTI